MVQRYALVLFAIPHFFAYDFAKELNNNTINKAAIKIETTVL
jgi:hypothetical protein